MERLECVDDSSIDSVKKGISAMEADLRKREKQERRYSDELDVALRQYTELRGKAKELDPMVLHDARQALRPDKERDAAARIQNAYGEKYSPRLMAESKRHVAGLLHEDVEVHSTREQLMRKPAEQKNETQEKPHLKPRHRDCER